MKTTLTLKVSATEQLHSVQIYKNGHPFAVLSPEEAAKPWVDEQSRDGDIYFANTIHHPKKVPLDPVNHPGAYVDEITHGVPSAHYVVNYQPPTVVATSVSIEGTSS